MIVVSFIIGCTKTEQPTSPAKIDTTETMIREKGGTLNARLEAWPQSWNEIIAGDGYSKQVAYLVMEPLVEQDQTTNDVIPRLAERWEESADHLTLTFYINKNAKFSDGVPVTAEDVKFTYDTVFSKECIECAATRGFLDMVDSWKVIDPQTIQFKIKYVHFDNVYRVGNTFIYAKHFYEKSPKNGEKAIFRRDFNKIQFGSNAYTFDTKEFEDKRQVVLIRNKNYWGNALAPYKDMYNFDKIVFKYVLDDTVAFEMFKKKELDELYFNIHLYDKWDKSDAFPFTDPNVKRISAVKIMPAEWRGIALNMRKAPTDELKFRQALQYLTNTKLIIEKVFNNHFTPISGPFALGSLYSADIPPIEYNETKATELLKEIGYTKTDSDGILYKEVTQNGKKAKVRAQVEIMYGHPTHERWLTMIANDALKQGVKLNLKYVDWSTATKLTHDFKFDGFVISWSGEIVPNPEQLFNGKLADEKGSSNYTGLNDAAVDSLMAKAPSLYNLDERYKTYHELEKGIIDNQPYIFLWSIKNHHVAVWSDRVNTTETPFLKYTGDNKRILYVMRWYKGKNNG